MPKQKYYITTAIDYPNAKPHMGHAYEKVVADALARWRELKGDDVFFLTGTDEHGQKIEKAAVAAKKTPKQFTDEMIVHFKDLCGQLNVSYSEFIRTTDKRHTKTAVELFKKVMEKGLIYKGTYSGLYCTGCESFKTDKELQAGLCPDHLKAPEQLSEESYFFKLSEFQQRIVQHIEQNPLFIQPESRRNEILSRLKEPLKDLSVSRTSFKWGIPLPFDKKHVIYVWFDALLNYISGIGYPTRKFNKYWPCDVHVIGKDIIWFHTVIWPAILMACDIPLPKTVFAHGHITNNGQKMSKSLGNVIDPVEIVSKYGADPFRFVLLRDVPAHDDGDFSEENLVARNNTELADALGNLLQRTSVLIHKNFQGNIPVCGKLTDKEKELEDAVPKADELSALMDSFQWNFAVEKIWAYINRCNKYVNDTEPWKLSSDPERLATVLYTLVEHLRIIGVLVWPFIPSSAEKICAQIGQKLGKLKDAKFTKKTKGALAQPQILFRKIDAKNDARPTSNVQRPTSSEPTAYRVQNTEEPFSKLNLKVARIEEVQNHPNADKLYVLKLNAGSEQRQLVAGMKEFYKPEELKGRLIVFVSNLKPAMLRGVESQGMMLAGEKDGKVKALDPGSAEPGDQVYVEGVTPNTAQITIDDFQKVSLTTKSQIVYYGERQLKTHNGPVKVELGDGAKIR